MVAEIGRMFGMLCAFSRNVSRLPPHPLWLVGMAAQSPLQILASAAASARSGERRAAFDFWSSFCALCAE